MFTFSVVEGKRVGYGFASSPSVGVQPYGQYRTLSNSFWIRLFDYDYPQDVQALPYGKLTGLEVC